MMAKFLSRPAVARNCGVIAGLLLTLTVSARAQLTNSWISIGSAGKWEIAANWSLGVAPSNNQAIAGITNATTKTVTIDATTVLSNAVNGCMTVSNFAIIGFGAGINTLQLMNAGTATPLLILNEFDIFTNAALVVTNSALRVAGLSGGLFVLDGGTVTIDGVVVATNADTLIGHNFASSYTMHGGTQQLRSVSLGDNPTGNGTLTAAGGVSTLSSNLLVGFVAGGRGTVWVTGGQLTVTNAGTAIGFAGDGQISVSNGTLVTREAALGYVSGSHGTLTVAGGNCTMANAGFSLVTIGNASNAVGTVWVTGGQLTFANGLTSIGGFGDPKTIGQVTVSNGTWQAQGVSVGGSSGSQGTLTVAGGTNLFSSVTVGYGANATGTVRITGGQLVATNGGFPSIIGNSGVGQMMTSTGLVLVTSMTVGSQAGSQGTLTVAGGTNIFNSGLIVGDFAGSTGAVWVTGGRLVTTNFATFVGFNGVGQLTVSNGSFVTGTMDVGDNGGSRGTLAMFGVTNTWTALTIGDNTSATGAVWLTDAQLTVSNGTSVAAAGVGQLTMSNSTLQTTLLNVGGGAGQPGAQGTLTIVSGTVTCSGGGAGSFALFAGGSANGTGTVWLISGQLVTTNADTRIGEAGAGRLTVSNGTWLAQNVTVGGSAGVPRGGGTLTLVGGTINVLSNLTIGPILTGGAPGSTGTVWMTGGQLFVANKSIIVGRDGFGRMIISNGTVTVSSLMVTNSTDGFAKFTNTITFAGGLINSAATVISNTLQFADGDGTDAAEFHLLGGVHSFGAGVRVLSNAFLTGCGTINGVVVVDPGGSVVADCGGSLTFAGSVTNNGIMHAENGSVLEAYGPVVNNGIIDIMDGTTNFHAGIVNNGTIVDASYFRVTSITKQSDDINIVWTTVGGRGYIVQTNAPPPGGSSTNNFTGLSSTIDFPGTTLGATNFLDTGGATNKPARFYRVRLVP